MKEKVQIADKNLNKKPSPGYAWNYFESLFKKTTAKPLDAHHILTAKEQQAIRLIEVRAMFLSACFGTLGVLTLYLPYYYFSAWFWNLPVPLPGGGHWDFPLVFSIYGVFLAILEITALYLLNLNVVYQISRICAYPHPEDSWYEVRLRELFEMSLDKSNKNLLSFGLNPQEGMSKSQIFFYTTFNIIKATLSNWLIKFLLARIFARLAIVRYVDLIGIPVFACWNAYATYRIIREAKVRIMAPNLILNFTQRLHKQFNEDQDFKGILMETLQLIAMAKRSFHHNHYWLAENIIHTFGLSLQRTVPLKEEELIRELRALDFEERQGLAKLFILGMLIDGKISRRDRKILHILSSQKLIDFDFSKIKHWEKSFLQGKGLDSLLEAKVVS